MWCAQYETRSLYIALHLGHRLRLLVEVEISAGGSNIRATAGGAGVEGFGFAGSGGLTGSIAGVARGSSRFGRSNSCSSSRCRRPASHLRLLSSSEGFALTSGSRAGGSATGLGGCSTSTTAFFGAALEFGSLERNSSASFDPLRFAHSIAFRPRLSRRCGSAPALTRSWTRLV